MRSVRRFSVISTLAFTVALVGTGGASAQGTWSSLAPVPSVGTGVEGMQVEQVGNVIIAAFGFDNGTGDTITTRIYDVDADTWTTGANGPLPMRSEGDAVAHGGKFYAIGGRGPLGVLADNDRYDSATDTWVSLADMPTARAGLAVAVFGNAIYAIGGRDSGGGPCSQGAGGEFATVERYDIDTDTWTTVAALPSPRSDLGAFEEGGKIYVFGGCRNVGGPVFLNDVDVYNPVTDTWSTAPTDMPTARAAFYGVGGKGNEIIVIGGWAGGGPLPNNEAYRVAKGSWRTDTPMQTPRAEMGVASQGGRIYTVGGALPAFGASSNANEALNP
jgi:hypothetical protein